MSIDVTAPEYTALHDEWARVEAFNEGFLIQKDESLDAARKNQKDQGLPDIAVAPNEGKFLNLLAKSVCARRIIEIGTLGGYSTIWLARALPIDGKLVTFELNEHHAKVAQENFKTAGVADKISVVLGSATETLPKFQSKEQFDLAFVDADKASCPIYHNELKRLVRKGGVIVYDNVVRSGKVADLNVVDGWTTGVRDLFEIIKNDPCVEATVITTVGSRGWDGFLLAYVK